jgi:hypothetical protein
MMHECFHDDCSSAVACFEGKVQIQNLIGTTQEPALMKCALHAALNFDFKKVNNKMKLLP